MTARRLSLAAGTLRRSRRPDGVRAAAAVGFDAVGVRFDVDPPSPDDLDDLRRVLADTGLSVLDLEVVRIVPGDDADATRRLVDQGAEVGAEFLLVVSDDPDRARTIDRFAETAAVAAEAGMGTALEFMRFTAVPTLADALEVVAAAGAPASGVVVDPLHLARSGGSPGDVASTDPRLLPYAQLCDAPGDAPGDPTDASLLADEARHGRLLPGSGDLPLGELVAALPPVPLSVEILSDVFDALPAADVARRAIGATRRLLDGEVAARGPASTVRATR